MYSYYNSNLDRINNQIKDLERLKAQYQQPVIQQNFMTNSNNDFGAIWVDNKEQAQKINVTVESILMDKEQPIFYLKEPDGTLKTYKFEEVIELDEKDLKITELEKRIKELEKRGVENEQPVIQPTKQQKPNK